MAVLENNVPTLLDYVQGIDGNGDIMPVVEVLKQTNPILEDMVFVEANELTGHKTTIRAGLPEPTWRKLYGGVQPTTGKKVAIRDTTGMLEDYSEVDKALADLNGNTAAFRFDEDRGHIEGMAQKAARSIFYEDEKQTSEAITGFAPRYNSISAPNGKNIIDANGTGSDLTSIWLVVWGKDKVHGIFPKGSRAGLQVTDKGQVTIENAVQGGGRMEAYRTHYRWDLGLVVRDWRYVVRIANIEVSDLDTIANTKLLVQWMIQASSRIPNMGGGKPVWYMNPSTHAKLRLGILEKVGANLTWDTVTGQYPILRFDGIPVRPTDAILNTESEVQ